MKYLVDEAKSVLKNAHCPYSNFPVGCAIEMKDGTIIHGVNVENISFGGTICAERTAINAAITKGYKKGDFKAIAVIANTESFVRPCHICRQSFNEFFEDDLKVAMSNKHVEFEVLTVGELAPYSFKDFD